MQNTITKHSLLLTKLSRNFSLLLFSFLLFAFQANAADFFWVGGTGNWSDFATHWATTSGGATFRATAPTAADNVFFDTNSGTAGYTITLDVVAVANNFTFSGNAFSFAGANSLQVNGTSSTTSTSIITFGGSNTYTFTGAYTAVATSQTSFTGSGAVAFNNSITIGNGSTFSFTPSAITTVTGAFNSVGSCATPNTVNSSGASASVNFGVASVWQNTNVTNIAGTGSAITVQRGIITTSTGITNAVLASRILFWVGGTGNWNDIAKWSLASGGVGGECIPTAIDDVNFDALSGLTGQAITLNVAAPVRNFNYNVTAAGATFIASNPLTVNGTTNIATTSTVNFTGANVVTFTGNFTAGIGTTTAFSNGNLAAFGNVSIGEGSTFRFSSATGGTATVSGTFIPNGNCNNPIILSATGAFTAPVNFAVAQTWSGVNVTQINSTGANVTVNSISVVITGNFTNPTLLGRTLYWVGGTGNWSDPARWSLASNGTGGGECAPTGIDDVNFNSFSFPAAGQSVTMDVNGICKNMDWTSGTGVTNNPRFAGAAIRVFTITGSLTFAGGMTQTGLTSTYEGLVVFNSTTAQTITMAGKGLNRVNFTTASAGQWTVQDNFLVQNQTLLNSGTFITNNRPISTGSLSTNNASQPDRTLDLGSSVVTLTSPNTTVLDYRNDLNFTLNSATSTINIAATGSIIETGSLAKTLSNITYTAAGVGNRAINTGNLASTITFGNIIVSDNDNFNITGTSPKVYQNITIGNTVTGTITGVATSLGNSITGAVTLGTGGTTTFSGGYDITGNLSAGNTKAVIFNGTGNNTFTGAFTLGTSATATFNNVTAGNTNSFSTINMNGGSIFRFNAEATAVSTVSGTINSLGSCATPITLTSNNPPTQARLNLTTALSLVGATVQNINAIGAGINVSSGTLANNSANVTGNTISRNLFWVHSVAGIGSTALWDSPANWSATSGGTTGQCPPTIYDNVNFDALSFSAANQIVNMNVNAFCRNMDWTGVTNTPFLRSVTGLTDLTIGGNLIFVPNMTVGTGGANPTEIRDIYFAATNAIPSAVATTNNTIDWGIGNAVGSENTNGKRFRAAFFNQNKEMSVATTVTWTLLSAFNLTQAPPNGRLTLQNGNIITDNNSMQIRILDANNANGTLNIGNSIVTLRATGLTFDFQNDALFTFVTGATSQFILSSNGANVIGFTGSVAKTMPTIIVPSNTNVTLNTGNGTNRITFRNIDLPLNNVTLNIAGTSPKTYSTPLSFNTGINATFTGSSAVTPNHNIFTGNVAFATGVQANFVGENQFQGTFIVGSTVNNTTGIRFTGTGRNQFGANVSLGGSSSFFSLQNTSASPNTFTTVSLTNTPIPPTAIAATVWEFSAGSPNTVAGAFTISADCIAPVIIRGNGGIANVAFATNQTWNNVTVQNINETGAGTVTVLSTTNGGGNSNIIFTVANRVLYWVGRTGVWGNPANWSISSGGPGGECIPTINDDVFFDVNSFNAAGQTVTVDVDAQTRDMTWTGATGTPNIVQGATGTNMQIGGDVTLITAMNWNYNAPVIFRYSDELEADAKNVIISAGQVFQNVVNFDDNVAPINGVWELGDAFATNAALFLTAGTFTTSPASYTLRAANINVNQAGDLTRTLNFNSSVTTLTLNNGTAFNATGNSTNFSLLSTATSQIRLTGNGNINIETGTESKTFPNLFVDVTTQTVEILTSAANRITFRDITWMPVGVLGTTNFRVLGTAPKTYGKISINNNIRTEIRGHTTGQLNFYNGTVTFGTNTRADIYGNNEWSAALRVGSTTNAGDAFYFRDNNEFLNTAPVTFTNAGRARVTIADGNRSNIFRAPVRFEGVPNTLDFNGVGATSVLEFFSTLFIQSTLAQQAFVNFDARPRFHDDVTFREAAGGNATTPVRFQRGLDFTPAVPGKKFITGIDSRFEFFAGGTSVFRDMEIAENNVLTFNNDLTVDNMVLSRFDVINFPNSAVTLPVTANRGVTTVNGYITAREGCAGWINLRSNLTGIQAEIDFELPHTVAAGNRNFLYTFLQDIFNRGDIKLAGNPLQIVEADPDIVSNIGNNTNITFINNQPARDFYWVPSINNRLPANINTSTIGDWNGLGNDNHWAIGDSTGLPQGCIPTANDNVWFTTRSFDNVGDRVNIDNFFSYCKNMTWTATNATRGTLLGDDLHTVQVFGSLLFANFSSDMDWNDFEGTFEFKGTNIGASKTITSRGSRFNGPVVFNAPNDILTIQDNMRVERGGSGDITFNYGQVRAGATTVTLQGDWLVTLPTGGLPQSRFVAQTSTVVMGAVNQVNSSTIDVRDFATTAATCFECSSITDPLDVDTKQACSGSPFYNLTVRKRRDLQVGLTTTISLYNDLRVDSGTLIDNGNQIRGNATGETVMLSNTRLLLGANNLATVFPSCYVPTNVILSSGTPNGLVDNTATIANGNPQASIVEYRSPDDQMVAGGTGFNYGTLRLVGGTILQGNNRKRFTGEATINGAFFIGDIQIVYDMGYQIRGNSYNSALNRLTTGTDAVLVLGTNQTVAERTYTTTFVPLNVTIPTLVAVNLATTFPKFTVGDGTFGDGIFSDTKVSLITTSTVIYNANANQEVAGGITYGNIILRSTGSTLATPILKTVTRHNPASAGTMTIEGNALVESFNHFIDDGYQITGNGTGTFISQANSKLILGTPTSGTNFPSLFTRATITLDPNTHETIYNADVPQLMSTEPNYGNVTLTAPTSAGAALIEKRFRSVGTPSGFTTAIINGNLIINPRNHLIDEGNQITGLAPKSVTMNSDLPLGESMLTIGTNGGTDIASQFPLTFGTVVLNDLTTVIYNTGSSLAQNVRGAGLNGIATGTDSYYNLIIQSGNEFTAIKTLQNPTRIRNNFTIRTGSRFEDNNNQVTGSTTATAGILTMENGAVLYIGVNDPSAPTVFPTNYERARIILDNNSTVRYQSRNTGAGQLVSSEPVYGNLFLDAGFGSYFATNHLKRIAPTPVLATNTTLTVTRNLTVNYGVRFEDMGVQIVGNNVPANVLLVQDGSELVLGTNGLITLFPTNYLATVTNIDLKRNATNKTTIIYNSGLVGAGNIISSRPIYGNLTLNNAAATPVTKSLDGNTAIYGNLIIGSRNILEVTPTNHRINLRGNWTTQTDGVFNFQRGRVVLEGNNTVQELRTNSVQNQKFYELEASATGTGSFRMFDNVIISGNSTLLLAGKAIFNNGLFNPNDIGPASIIKMIFEQNATVGGSGIYTPTSWISTTAPVLSANGPSNTSHVVGKVEKQGLDAFMFPIGNGTNYAPAGLGVRTNTNSIFEARYIGPRLPDLDGYITAQKEVGIQIVSQVEYWTIDKLSVSVDPAYVYLSWDNPRSVAYQPEGLLVLRWEGLPNVGSSIWQNRFNGGHSNSSANGIVASQAQIANFSPFTLGSVNNLNPLPLDLLSFNAKIEGESVKVTWETTNEIDNSHFLVERSEDSNSFGSLGRVNAKGTGIEGRFNYQFWDTEPFDGLSYYRLKMFDLDGKFKYSPVRSILFEKIINGIKGEISLYPNPNGGARFYLNLEGKLTIDAQVEIIDMIGRIVHRQDVQKGVIDIIVTPRQVLKAGTYILRFVTAQETITKKFVVE